MSLTDIKYSPENQKIMDEHEAYLQKEYLDNLAYFAAKDAAVKERRQTERDNYGKTTELVSHSGFLIPTLVDKENKVDTISNIAEGKGDPEKPNFTFGKTEGDQAKLLETSQKSTIDFLEAIAGIATGQLLGGDFENTVTIKERISHNLQQKMMMASLNATSLLEGAMMGYTSMDAYAEQAKKKNSYETLNQQLSISFTKLNSKDEVTRNDGFKTIRNLSLGLQQLEQEKLVVQNLGHVLEGIKYLETMNSDIVQLEKTTEGFRSILESFFEDNSKYLGGNLNKKQTEELQGKVVGLFSLFGIKEK